MRHFLAWLLTLAVIAGMSAMVYELLLRGGIYAALVPWALAASLWAVFRAVSAPRSAAAVHRKLLAQVGVQRDLRAKLVAKEIETGDLVLVSRFAPSFSLTTRVFAAHDQVANGSVMASILRVPVGAK